MLELDRRAAAAARHQCSIGHVAAAATEQQGELFPAAGFGEGGAGLLLVWMDGSSFMQHIKLNSHTCLIGIFQLQTLHEVPS